MKEMAQTATFAVRCAGCRRLFASASAEAVFCRTCWEMQIAEGHKRPSPDFGGSSVPTDIRYVFVLAGRLEAAAETGSAVETGSAEASTEASGHVYEGPDCQAETEPFSMYYQTADWFAGIVGGLSRRGGRLRSVLTLLVIIAGLMALGFVATMGQAEMQGWDQ